jgi:hypothetical protein
MQIHEDHGRVRCLYRQYCMAGNTPQQKQLLALDIIRHSNMHSKKEDMVRAAVRPGLLSDVIRKHMCAHPSRLVCALSGNSGLISSAV